MLDPKDILKAGQIKPSVKDPEWLKKGRQGMALYMTPIPADPKKGN